LLLFDRPLCCENRFGSRKEFFDVRVVMVSEILEKLAVVYKYNPVIIVVIVILIYVREGLSSISDLYSIAHALDSISHRT
jgi:hypothetical protein